MRRFLSAIRKDQRGIVLVIALLLLGFMSALAATYSALVTADTGLRGAAGRERQGFYAAEAGLNVGMAEFADIFKDYNIPTSGNGDFNLKTRSLGTRTINYQLTPIAGKTPGPRSNIPAGQLFGGLSTIPYEYVVNATATNPAGDQEAKLGAEFTVNNIPIFQFLAYYANDLEIYPGPAAVFHGRIHTNGNLFLGAGTSMSIIDSAAADPAPRITSVQVSAANRIYRSRKTNYDCTTAPILIDKAEDVNPADGSYDAGPNLACFGDNTPVPKATLATYLGTLKDQIPPISIPPVADLQRGGKFFTLADLRLVLRRDLGRIINPADISPQCPAGAPNVSMLGPLYRIEVQNSDGSYNDTLSKRLWAFMCERRGAIFYNDIPSTGTTTQGALASPPGGSDPAKFDRYTPAFGGNNDTDNRVYRRAGEDTNGDGVIDTSGSVGILAADITNNDQNGAICPITTNAATPRPAWRPDFCNRVFDAGGATARPWPNVRAAAGVGALDSGGTVPTTQNFPSSSWYADMDYRRGGFYNGREQQWVMMLNVNIRALIDWNESQPTGSRLFNPTDNTNGGLVFFLSVQANDSAGIPNGVRYGVRVFDSATLNSTTARTTFPLPLPADPTGLTIVSDQAFYVEGNYNYTSVNNNGTWYPAAIMADAINVLSPGWEVPVVNGTTYRNDRKTGSDMGTARVVPTNDGVTGVNAGCLGACRDFSTATPLGLYAAFLANVDNSVANGGYPTGYNGGFENYPRFHEDWSGRTLNYRGSFVSLGIPQHNNGTWNTQNSGWYSPPARNWDYDARFDDAAMLPPVTPQVVYVQQKVYTRFYQ